MVVREAGGLAAVVRFHLPRKFRLIKNYNLGSPPQADPPWAEIPRTPTLSAEAFSEGVIKTKNPTPYGRVFCWPCVP